MTREQQDADLEISRRFGIAMLIVLGGFCGLFAVAGSLLHMLLH
jgi:hypothetical protein